LFNIRNSESAILQMTLK